ncbi:hypothetical protein PFISCL1PPCAC_18506, partial [Pristionchus fissidentatus]
LLLHGRLVRGARISISHFNMNSSLFCSLLMVVALCAVASGNQCGPNQHYSPCRNECERMCQQPHTRACHRNCVTPGACTCNWEFVRHPNGACVAPTDC